MRSRSGCEPDNRLNLKAPLCAPAFMLSASRSAAAGDVGDAAGLDEASGRHALKPRCLLGRPVIPLRRLRRGAGQPQGRDDAPSRREGVHVQAYEDCLPRARRPHAAANAYLLSGDREGLRSLRRRREGVLKVAIRPLRLTDVGRTCGFDG